MTHFNCVPYHNNHNHSGHIISDLFVSPKYKTFKEEIFNYKHQNIYVYNKATTKVNNYLNTNKVKQLKPILWKWDSDWITLSYGIPKDAPISFNHLLSLSLYTDYTDLSTDFSSSFRPMKAFESLSSIKQRNSSYAHMARYLRETVQIYGRWNEDERDGKEAKDIWTGPWCMFYVYIFNLCNVCDDILFT